MSRSPLFLVKNMDRNLLKVIGVIVLFLSIVSISEVYSYGVIDIDAYGRVVYVVDGDTIDVELFKVFDSKYSSFLFKKIRIRFADINAPELYTYEGKLAKEFLYRLIYNKYVYLDIDDLYIYGKYGRIIAVVYLPINTSHLLNVNLYLVEKGYAEIRNYPNEFNPYTWKLYVENIVQTSTTKTTIPFTKTTRTSYSHRYTSTILRTTTVTLYRVETIYKTVSMVKTFYRTISIPMKIITVTHILTSTKTETLIPIEFYIFSGIAIFSIIIALITIATVKRR